jgi:fatty-acid desaturase
MIGTLTSSILKSIHNLISLIFFNKLCSVAIPGHPKPLLLENHVRIIALTLDLQRVSFYSIIAFLHHSFNHRAYTIPNTYKGVIRALRPYYNAGNRH